MKRHMDLIRLILAHVESATRLGRIPVPEISGYDEHEVQYHLRLCEEADYLVCKRRETGERKVTRIVRMTWAGHEALDELRRSDYDA